MIMGPCTHLLVVRLSNSTQYVMDILDAPVSIAAKLCCVTASEKSLREQQSRTTEPVIATSCVQTTQ